MFYFNNYGIKLKSLKNILKNKNVKEIISNLTKLSS
jgi:hypothetical protein